MRKRNAIGTMAALLAGLMLALGAATARDPLAKDLFGAARLPAAMPASSYGFYSKGCFSGGIAMAADGPNWQGMRLSRNRHWGHPELVETLERLSREAAADGWPGLLLGDMSQPRGGPMLSGHASHQIGLDADIWFMPMPSRRLTIHERENISAVSLLRRDSLHVDDRKWTRAHEAVLRRAASYRNVERILVHPGIKQKLCDTVTGDRSWLSKIRPFWGHDSHFHLRIGCPAGSTGCREQAAPPRGDGCDDSLAWWFTEEPWRPATGPEKPKARDVMTMASLPAECRAVLDAPAPASAEAVTVDGSGAIPRTVAPVSAHAYAPTPGRDIPLPSWRPENR
ncbi:MAG: penicillin-insensitive murein endopeptidase [Rhizobiaceae bacterium]|nr:penicillin-insensitive murein endopeptidase [Rhizobiaceae bacterium]